MVDLKKFLNATLYEHYIISNFKLSDDSWKSKNNQHDQRDIHLVLFKNFSYFCVVCKFLILIYAKRIQYYLICNRWSTQKPIFKFFTRETTLSRRNIFLVYTTSGSSWCIDQDLKITRFHKCIAHFWSKQNRWLGHVNS